MLTAVMRTIYPSSCRKQFSTIQGVQDAKCPFHNTVTVFETRFVRHLILAVSNMLLKIMHFLLEHPVFYIFKPQEMSKSH